MSKAEKEGKSRENIQISKSTDENVKKKEENIKDKKDLVKNSRKKWYF